MNEVYWAACKLNDEGCMQIVGTEQVIAPDRVSVPEVGGWTGAGTGWSAYGEILRATIGADVLSGQMDDCLPTAESIVRLAVAEYKAGSHVPAAQAVPVYLRDNVAKKSMT
jgi:tRNA threonylcarbamoyladenosine biosynthesis protein TsaB